MTMNIITTARKIQNVESKKILPVDRARVYVILVIPFVNLPLGIITSSVLG